MSTSLHQPSVQNQQNNNHNDSETNVNNTLGILCFIIYSTMSQCNANHTAITTYNIPSIYYMNAAVGAFGYFLTATVGKKKQSSHEIGKRKPQLKNTQKYI